MTSRPKPLEKLHDIDEQIHQQVADWHAPVLDQTLPPLSEAASYSRLWMVIAALIAAFGGRRGRRSAVAGMVAIGVTSALANIVVKGVANRRRPGIEVPEDRRLKHPDSTSFPSGHTASAAAFSGVIGGEIPELRLPINALAAAVGFSRVYTGVHYPGDVVAGWILGKGVAVIAGRVLRRIDTS
ncbi:MAG: phosphatase PAP2 family protein [Actinomycetota bacterium]